MFFFVYLPQDTECRTSDQPRFSAGNEKKYPVLFPTRKELNERPIARLKKSFEHPPHTLHAHPKSSRLTFTNPQQEPRSKIPCHSTASTCRPELRASALQQYGVKVNLGTVEAMATSHTIPF